MKRFIAKIWIPTLLVLAAAAQSFGIDLGNPPYGKNARFRDANKAYGPVDVVKKTYMRDDQEGLTFDQKLTLTFEYEIKIKDSNNVLREVDVDSSLGVIKDFDVYDD